MRGLWKRGLVCALLLCMVAGTAGCHGKNKTARQSASPKPSAAEDVSSERATALPEVKAGGKGQDKSDVPLVIACDALERKFNPFSAKTKEDQRAVDFTQLRLLTFDREGALVQHAIEGEKRRYNGEEFSYQGPADVKIRYDKKKKQTSYTIRIRKDLTFSDGNPVEIDDVIFSMYAFADTSYQGVETFGELPIVGLEKYRGKGKNGGETGSLAIDGIEKLSDYKVRVTVKGCGWDNLEALNIPICSLKFYGDAKDFNVLAGSFGFSRGDISSLIRKKNAPLGAGAYRYIKYEKGIVYYEANEQYYLGCPQTAFIQLKEMGEQTPLQKLEALANGDYDVVDMEGSDEAVEKIMAASASGKLTGTVYGAKAWDGEAYTYIGMDAKRVCVDGKADSTRSKNLRQAFAILFGCNRSSMVELCEKGAAVIEYPASRVSWSVPQGDDEEYEQAYSRDADGNMIYNSNMEIEERSDAACKAALGYLKKAGFRVKKGKVVSVPENTKRKYVLCLPSDMDGQGMLTLVRSAQRLFRQIGLKLEVVTDQTQKQLETRMKKGTEYASIWCAAEQTSVSGALNAMYHSRETKDTEAGSRNYFHIADSDLDEVIEDSMQTVKQKKSTLLYEQAYQKILEWAVEVPVYQEQMLTVYSSARVNMDTVAQDITRYYDWTQEIQVLEMK